MRKITSHIVNPCNENLLIEVADEVGGAGGASHCYYVTLPPSSTGKHQIELSFQNGPISEVGTNGITNEVLIAILIDRLDSFQAGKYACNENMHALVHLAEAQMWLQKRTRDRMERCVEGTHAV